MEDYKFDRARLIVDSVIYGGENFTLKDLYNLVEEDLGERVEWISEYTSIQAYINDLLSLHLIVPMPPYEEEKMKKAYRLKSAVKTVKVS